MIAIDQYGNRLHIPGKHPRKELLAKLGAKHAEKIYVDKTDGRTVHVGYVIGGSWWSLFIPFER